ncbi:MAG: replication-associated recombination protein A [bacterium]|nr:replication-associated recombination protein A [bacterium]
MSKDLFSQNADAVLKISAPLAERMRPQDFDDFVGQESVAGPEKPLRKSIQNDTLQSVILWGPPGSGKTTLAHIISQTTKAFFQPFSAATSGIPELRAVIKDAEERLKFHKQRTILFVDEIHRFNKTQQDAFLPHVEHGTIILIGATTENPSFAIVAPLMSRSLLLVLHPLAPEHIRTIIDNTLKDAKRGFGKMKIAITDGAKEMLVQFADGDARVALNSLEFVVMHTLVGKNNTITIDEKIIEDALQKKALRYDKTGEEHYNVISAFIKSMRDSDPDGALYWLSRMIEAGEDPRFIARRMVIFASEDVGMADIKALLVANAVFDAVERIGLPEAQINLAHGVVYLAQAPKDNSAYMGLLASREDVQKYGALPVPLHLRNAVTKMMKGLGYGKGYKYAHDAPDAKVMQEHLPEKLKGGKYYKPKK